MSSETPLSLIAPSFSCLCLDCSLLALSHSSLGSRLNTAISRMSRASSSVEYVRRPLSGRHGCNSCLAV